jgi:hypothetical protein
VEFGVRVSEFGFGVSGGKGIALRGLEVWSTLREGQALRSSEFGNLEAKVRRSMLGVEAFEAGGLKVEV